MRPITYANGAGFASPGRSEGCEPASSAPFRTNQTSTADHRLNKPLGQEANDADGKRLALQFLHRAGQGIAKPDELECVAKCLAPDLLAGFFRQVQTELEGVHHA